MKDKSQIDAEIERIQNSAKTLPDQLKNGHIDIRSFEKRAATLQAQYDALRWALN